MPTDRPNFELPEDLAFGDRIEALFERWGYWVVEHRWWAIAASLLLTAYLCSWLPLLTIDNSVEGFLLPDDPATIRYDEFRDRFDRDDRIVIALAPPDVFAPDFLKVLREFHLALEAELPYVEEILSVFNARSTRGEGGELIVGELLEGWLETWPEDLSELANLRERIFDNPLYVNTLVSEDARLTTLTIKPFTYSTLSDAEALSGFDTDAGEEAEFLTAWENDELLAAIHEVIARFESPEFPIHLGGPLAVTDHINRSMMIDTQVYFGASFVVITLLLFALFRRFTATILPLIVVAFSVFSAIGTMILLDIPGTTAVQILPAFLLAVGVCDAVHILAIVNQRLALNESQKDAIAFAVGHSGLAVLMTSLTTGAGLASFITAEMAPVQQLGIIAPIGVGLAFLYTLVLLPAALAVVPLKPPSQWRWGRGKAGSPDGILVQILTAIGDFASSYPRSVLTGAAIFVAICISGATQVRFSHLATDWFPEDEPIRVAMELLDRELRGSISLEVLIDSGRENGLHEPELLGRIEEAMKRAESFSTDDVFVGKAISIVDIVKETHQALNDNDPARREIPQNRQLIAQELLLFENGGADDLQEIVDTQFQTARLSLRAPFVDALLYSPFIDALEPQLRDALGEEVEMEMTGFMPVLTRTMKAVITSMGRSYLFALVVITPMMMLLLRSAKLGLVSMIPNLIPVIFGLGLMGWLDFVLDATTIMVGAMVIGIAVDDTIHFMHKFQLYYNHHGDPRRAVRETLRTTGAALLITTLVLSGGFWVIAMGTMVNTQHFGIVAASCTVVAFVADVLVAPALMTLAARKGRAGLQAARVQ